MIDMFTKYSLGLLGCGIFLHICKKISKIKIKDAILGQDDVISENKNE